MIILKKIKYIKFRFNFIFKIIKSRLIGFFWSKKNYSVLFYLPSDHEIVSGGILSIFYLYEETKKKFPDSVVEIIFMNRNSKVREYKWFSNDVKIKNIFFERYYISGSNQILIHVPEVYISKFKFEWKKNGLTKFNNKTIINILNQNNELMPNPDDVYLNLKEFKRITMTLAFIRNLEPCKINFPNLDIFVLSAWFYKTTYQIIPFEQKTDLILISPDAHSDKQAILNELNKCEGLEIFEMNYLPYEKFLEIQKRAKWTITFGEGYDNYFQGAYLTGGIGFSVYNEEFFNSDFENNKFPQVIFKSYADLRENICNSINLYNSKIKYDSLSQEIRTLVLKNNNEDIVRSNLHNYYNNIYLFNNLK